MRSVRSRLSERSTAKRTYVPFTRTYVRFAVERSLKRLRTDRIDLLQLHNPPINLITEMDTYAVLEDLKREGLIRFYGVSVHPPGGGGAAINVTVPPAGQSRYNLGRRGPWGAVFEWGAAGGG